MISTGCTHLPAPFRMPTSRRFTSAASTSSTWKIEITELAAHIHAATFRLLELVREYDECEGWGGKGLTSCAHWLNWKCGIDLGTAREKVRVAHSLKELPQISEEFRAGPGELFQGARHDTGGDFEERRISLDDRLRAMAQRCMSRETCAQLSQGQAYRGIGERKYPSCPARTLLVCR